MRLISLAILYGILCPLAFVAMALTMGFVVASPAHGAALELRCSCGYVAADGTLATGEGHAVITDFTDGVARIVCRATVPAPGRSIRWDYSSTGLGCGAGRDLSATWREDITPSGQVTLTCWLRRGASWGAQ